jgi:cellulase/cellobiase CelA1
VEDGQGVPGPGDRERPRRANRWQAYNYELGGAVLRHRRRVQLGGQSWRPRSRQLGLDYTASFGSNLACRTDAYRWIDAANNSDGSLNTDGDS